MTAHVPWPEMDELDRLRDRISYKRMCRRYFRRSRAPAAPSERRRLKREIRDLVRRRDRLARRSARPL